MPKYGQFRYGRIGRYGKYDITTTHSKAIGDYVQYRMRVRNANGESEYLTMFQERVSIPSETTVSKVRIRANGGEWVHTQSDTIDKETFAVRIRTIGSNGQLSEWVESNKGNLKLI